MGVASAEYKKAAAAGGSSHSRHEQSAEVPGAPEGIWGSWGDFWEAQAGFEVPMSKSGFPWVSLSVWERFEILSKDSSGCPRWVQVAFKGFGVSCGPHEFIVVSGGFFEALRGA